MKQNLKGEPGRYTRLRVSDRLRSTGVLVLMLFVVGFPRSAQSADKQQLADDFYRLDNDIEIRITMPETEWNTLRQQDPLPQAGCIFNWVAPDPETDRYPWYHATVSITAANMPNPPGPGPHVFYDVGIRKKSYCGSANKEVPSLKVDFAEFDPDNEDPIEELIGTKHLVLNNSIQDSAYVRQCLGYGIATDAGLPASRCNFARVYVNDTLFQWAYVNVEPIKKRLIKKYFDDNDAGNLYELEVDEDFNNYMREDYYYELHDMPYFIDWKGLGSYIDENGDVADLTQKPDLYVAMDQIAQHGVEGIENVINLENFIPFWALENVLEHWDGFSGNLNNTYVYNDVTAVYSSLDEALNIGVGDVNFSFIMYGIDQILKSSPPGIYNKSVITQTLMGDAYYMTEFWFQVFDYLDTLVPLPAGTISADVETRINALTAKVSDILTQIDAANPANPVDDPNTSPDEGRRFPSEVAGQVETVKDHLNGIRSRITGFYRDMTSLEIVYPTAGDPVPAGEFGDPGKIWVMVRPTYVGLYDQSRFEVKINNQVATIIKGYAVQDQFWMVVQAPTVGSSTNYDLQVTELIGGNIATETGAVAYAEAGIPVDSVIVGDISYSMASCDKIDAARNAARLFLDHAGSDDSVGVVSFSVDPYLDYELNPATDVNLQAARDAVNQWAPVSTTALGKGVQTALDQLMTRGTNIEGRGWEMALLSDGMENVDPYWATPEVRGAVLGAPHDIEINTVALGADADTELMNGIATDTLGVYRSAAIDFCPATTVSARMMPLVMSSDDFNLSNELADIYKSFAEKARLEERIGDWSGIMEPAPPGYSIADDYYLTLESGLPEVIIALNWDSAGTPLGMYINDTYVPILPDGEVTQDATHVQYRLQNPAPGEYKISVANVSYYPLPTPYRLMASARSQINGMTVPESVQPTYTVGETVPIQIFVGDDLPIQDADVTAVVTSPTGTVQEITLVDDGMHNDSGNDDGLYGGSFVAEEGGPYTVVIIIAGTDNNGDTFTRRDPTVVEVKEVPSLSVCILGENSVDLRDRAVVTTDLAAGSYLEIGAPATLIGNGFVGGNAFIRSNGVVQGDLTLAGVLSDQGAYTITGNLTQNGSVVIPTLVTKTFATGSGTQQINGVQTLSPGNYGEVTIGAYADITLTAGTYNFASLTVWNNVDVYVDGGVEVNVEGNFQFGNGSQIGGGDLTVYSNGSQVLIGTDTVFGGILSAPNADIIIYSRTVINGCVGGENVTLDADVTLISGGQTLPTDSTPPPPTCTDGIKNGDETSIDCGGDICGGCEDGDICQGDDDCLSNNCEDFFCVPGGGSGCTEFTAVDLGGDGNETTVPTDGCVMVRNQYPSWWGVHTMMLQTTSPGNYPVSFTWSNACTGAGGTGSFTGDWQNQFLPQTDAACATLIDLQGPASGSVRLRYYGG